MSLSEEKLKVYTQLLQRILGCFDFDLHGCPITTIVGESGYTGTAMVGDELADLIIETTEIMEDYQDD